MLQILIAEDNQETAEALDKYLHIKIIDAIAAEIRVRIVPSLAEALAFSQEADLTILDLTLRDAGPEDVLAALKAKMFNSPIIVMTGDPDTIHHTQCRLYGADYVFIKGEISGLWSAVLHMLSREVIASVEHPCIC